MSAPNLDEEEGPNVTHDEEEIISDLDEEIEEVNEFDEQDAVWNEYNIIVDKILAQNALYTELQEQLYEDPSPAKVDAYKKVEENLKALIIEAIAMQNENDMPLPWPEIPIAISLKEKFLANTRKTDDVTKNIEGLLKFDSPFLRKCEENEGGLADEEISLTKHEEGETLENISEPDSCEDDQPSNDVSSDQSSDKEKLSPTSEIINALQNKIRCLEASLKKIKSEEMKSLSNTINMPDITEIEHRIEEFSERRMELLKNTSPDCKGSLLYDVTLKCVEEELCRLYEIKICYVNQELRQQNQDENKLERYQDLGEKDDQDEQNYTGYSGEGLKNKKCGKHLALLKTKSQKPKEIQELEKNYHNLLLQYDQNFKAAQMLKQILSDNISDDEEITVMKNKVKELTAEQEKFKFTFKEQEAMTEEYKVKSGQALHVIQKQCATIKQLEMDNRKIESQVNLTIQQVKSKFQSRLRQLVVIPKILENEKRKYIECTYKKEKLKNAFRGYAKELKAIKKELEEKEADNEKDALTNNEDNGDELEAAKREYEKVEKEAQLVLINLQKVQNDTNALRSETADIIARTNDKSQLKQEEWRKRIVHLEGELASVHAKIIRSAAQHEERVNELAKDLKLSKENLCSVYGEIANLKKQVTDLKSSLLEG